MEHFVFTDGMATISVYVEPASQVKNNFLQAGRLGQIGAVNAVGKTISDHQVVVVGEAPFSTLEILLAGIEK